MADARPHTPPAAAAAAAAPLACSYCGGGFASKNKLFAHLRDATNSCGQTVASAGGIGYGKAGPSNADARREMLASKGAATKHAKKKSPAGSGGSGGSGKGGGGGGGSATKKKKKRTHADMFTTSIEQELWMGDIPAWYGSRKMLDHLLWKIVKEGEPTPNVKRLFKKGWRQRRTFTSPGGVGGGGGDTAGDCRTEGAAAAAVTGGEPQPTAGVGRGAVETATGGELEPPPPPEAGATAAAAEAGAGKAVGGGKAGKAGKEWIGYAILAFRDAAEAAEALEVLQGRELAPGFILRLAPAARKGKPPAADKLSTVDGDAAGGVAEVERHETKVRGESRPPGALSLPAAC